MFSELNLKQKKSTLSCTCREQWTSSSSNKFYYTLHLCNRIKETLRSLPISSVEFEEKLFFFVWPNQLNPHKFKGKGLTSWYALELTNTRPPLDFRRRIMKKQTNFIIYKKKIYSLYFSLKIKKPGWMNKSYFKSNLKIVKTLHFKNNKR